MWCQKHVYHTFTIIFLLLYHHETMVLHIYYIPVYEHGTLKNSSCGIAMVHFESVATMPKMQIAIVR